jgi:hypothetical protein
MASSSELYNAITALSPSIYWTLDESSGNAIQQGSSTAGNLAFSGTFQQAATELIPGDSARFVLLDGGKGTASRGNITVPFRSFSATFLINIPETPTQVNATMFSIGATGETAATNFQFLYRHVAYPLTRTLWEYGDGSDEILDTIVSIYNKHDGSEFNTTKHVTIVKDSSNKTLSIFINGYLKQTLQYVNEPTGGTSTSFFIGGAAAAAPTETTIISMGHFAFFQRALTPQEVVDLTKASGFMPADYEIGTPEFSLMDEDSEQFANLQTIKQNLEYSANKLLSVSPDPLIDPSLLAGSEAYNII